MLSLLYGLAQRRAGCQKIVKSRFIALTGTASRDMLSTLGRNCMRHSSRKSESFPVFFGSARHQVRKLAVVAAGVVALAVGAFGAEPGSPVSHDQILSPIQN